jgi:hypothetical protein
MLEAGIVTLVARCFPHTQAELHFGIHYPFPGIRLAGKLNDTKYIAAPGTLFHETSGGNPLSAR